MAQICEHTLGVMFPLLAHMGNFMVVMEIPSRWAVILLAPVPMTRWTWQVMSGSGSLTGMEIFITKIHRPAIRLAHHQELLECYGALRGLNMVRVMHVQPIVII